MAGLPLPPPDCHGQGDSLGEGFRALWKAANDFAIANWMNNKCTRFASCSR